MTALRMLVLSLSLVAAAAAAEETFEVRVFDVHPQYRDEAVSALRRLFPPRNLTPEPRSRIPLFSGPRVISSSEQRIQLLPSGQIAVRAEPAVLEQVAAVLEAMESAAPGATPRVSLRYWVLFGGPADQAAGAPPPMLVGVIRELTEAYGNLSFSVVDTATVSGLASQSASLQSAPFAVEQAVYLNGPLLNADIRIQHDSQSMQVQVTLEPGEFLVLGGGTVERAQSSGVLAFVVHWPAGG